MHIYSHSKEQGSIYNGGVPMHALQGRYCSHNWGCGPNFAYLGWKHALQTTGAQSRL